MFRKIFFKSEHALEILSLFLIFILALLASRTLIFKSGYFIMHDDLQMMRQFQMEKCFLDGQIPCRWVPDMGYGFGFPLFNFYPPLPYLIGEIFRVFGFSFVNSIKLTFALSFVVSGIAMYLLAKKFFGCIGGALSAIFYIWAPYHAVDIFVRGAMNEAWALVWFPLIFWTSYKLITDHKSQITKNIVFLSLSYFALFTSHNLMVMIFTPLFIVWILIHLWIHSAWNRIPQLILSVVLSFGLSAFFTIPVIFEKNLVRVELLTQGYYDYLGHFVSIKQLLLSRFWGDGSSAWGIENDGMSFQIGHFHWILSLVVGLLLLIRLLFRKEKLIKRLKNDSLLLTTYYLLFTGWFAAFLAHSRSTFIWLAIPILRYLQFPWRFLTITIFAFSFIVGFIPGVVADWKSNKNFIIKLLVTPHQIFWVTLFSISLVVANWNYFKPVRSGAVTDKEKFSGEAWRIQQAAGIYDYLPITAKEAPSEQQVVLAEITQGQGSIEEAEQGSYWVSFTANIESKAAKVRINILDFPGWRVFDENNTELKKYIPEEEEWGRIWIDLPSGNHQIYAQFMNTPVRRIANLISIFSWGILLIWTLKPRLRLAPDSYKS